MLFRDVYINTIAARVLIHHHSYIISMYEAARVESRIVVEGLPSEGFESQIRQAWLRCAWASTYSALVAAYCSCAWCEVNRFVVILCKFYCSLSLNLVHSVRSTNTPDCYLWSSPQCSVGVFFSGGHLYMSCNDGALLFIFLHFQNVRLINCLYDTDLTVLFKKKKEH